MRGEQIEKLLLIKAWKPRGKQFFDWIDKVQMRKLISYCYFVEGRSIDEVPTLTFHPVNLSATHQPGTLTSLNTWIPLAPYFISRRHSTNQQASEFHETVHPKSIITLILCLCVTPLYRWSETMIWMIGSTIFLLST